MPNRRSRRSTRATPSDDWQTLATEAMQLARAGRFDEALPRYRRVVQQSGNHLGMRLHLARVLAHTHELDEARAIVRDALAEPGCPPDAFAEAASLLEEAHLHAEAADTRDALAARPDAPPDAHTHAGRLAERLNRLDAAHAALDRVPADQRNTPDATLLRARLHRRAGEHDDALRAYADLAARPGLDDPTRAAALAGAADAADRLGDHPAAWAYATQRHALLADEARTLRDAHPRLTDAPPGTPTVKRDLDPPAVLLTGFPRSGTTLAGRVLAAEPGVAYADETACLERLLAQLFAHPTPPPVRRLRDAYTRAIRQRLGPDTLDNAAILLDKNPGLCGALPALRWALPDLRVVWCQRDPRDVFVSCYLCDLPVNAFTCTFGQPDAFVEHYQAVHHAAARWRDELSADGRWLDVSYEQLVEQGTDTLDAAWRAWLDTAQLGAAPPNAPVGDVHALAAQAAINSPTYADVLQPAHTRRVARWTAYQDLAPEAFDRLAALVR